MSKTIDKGLKCGVRAWKFPVAIDDEEGPDYWQNYIDQ
jgi:hypothetical protein